MNHVDHRYATLARLDKGLHRVPADALPPLVKRLGQIAADWGAEFGYGISDELTAVANEWREKLG